MKKALVFGGTRFFGKRLVELLLEQGVETTIATRGQTADSFGERVTRIQLDREDRSSLEAGLGTGEWDTVFDNICYSPNSALDACELFKDRVGKYVYTSSMSVYDLGAGLTEDVFDPYTYPIIMGTRSDFPYGEAKRLAEAVYFQQAAFPVSAVRFPIVLGTDDYTRRLHVHIERVSKELPIGMPNPQAEMVFIRSDEAARFLLWQADASLTGPFNACSNGSIALEALIKRIEAETGKTAQLVPETEEAGMSPFGVPESWTASNRKAANAGFTFLTLGDWLPELVETIAHSE
ncbi:NAD-dependent epimerase/dehydratase family protein [Gorillibacterium timonense]|uniref:NAD-dependent epimerase/dehydratase family protein n=1 Tax=Gorillibacterium timonense TaxID=1689269 RepID=UPI00071E65C9|nr:NAD-dependent epimerase/dehydratase family protein [Gorillibacterium timonense]